MKNTKILYKIKHMFEENKIEFKSEEDRKKFHDLIHAFDHHVKPDVDKNDSENEFDLVK